MKKIIVGVILPLSAIIMGLTCGLLYDCSRSEPAIVSNKIVRSYQNDLYYKIFSRDYSDSRNPEVLQRRAAEVHKLADIRLNRACPDIDAELDFAGLYMRVFSPDTIFGSTEDNLWCCYSFIGFNGEYSVWKGRKKVCEFDVFPQVSEVNCLYYNKNNELAAACKSDVYTVIRRDSGGVYSYVKLLQPFKADGGCRLKAFFSEAADRDKALYNVALKLYRSGEKELMPEKGVDVTDYADYACQVLKARPVSAAIEAAPMKDRLLFESADGNFSDFKASLRTVSGTLSVSEWELLP